MEFRTCEEYVLSELMDAKSEIENLKQLLAEERDAHKETTDKLTYVMESFQGLKDLILNNCKVWISTYNTPEAVYDVGYLWNDNKDLLLNYIPKLKEKEDAAWEDYKEDHPEEK